MGETISVGTAARLLDVRVDEIYRLLRSGRLVGRKVMVGKASRWIIERGVLQAYANNRRNGGSNGN